ncbi:MAG: SDR family oxidoreductase [Planctomycetota bacterium]|nr:SDR family oxidoreductase [Planctomycetota bacterium]
MAAEHGVVIVTGAGSGIGRASVLCLAEAGYACLLVGRRSETLEETASLCSGLSGSVVPHLGDVSKPNEISAIVSAAINLDARLQGIVNNAAAAGLAVFPHWAPEQVEDMWQTNVLGPISLVQEAWSHLVTSGGRIVNMSSLAVLSPFPGNGLYGISKCALDGLTRAIQSDTQDSGVKAFSIAPGAVETDMLRTIVDETQLPPAKAMAPDEIARLVLACISGERDQDAGEVLYAAIPGFVTTDPDEAMAAMGRFHNS